MKQLKVEDTMNQHCFLCGDLTTKEHYCYGCKAHICGNCKAIDEKCGYEHKPQGHQPPGSTIVGVVRGMILAVTHRPRDGR